MIVGSIEFGKVRYGIVPYLADVIVYGPDGYLVISRLTI